MRVYSLRIGHLQVGLLRASLTKLSSGFMLILCALTCSLQGHANGFLLDDLSLLLPPSHIELPFPNDQRFSLNVRASVGINPVSIQPIPYGSIYTTKRLMPSPFRAKFYLGWTRLAASNRYVMGISFHQGADSIYAPPIYRFKESYPRHRMKKPQKQHTRTEAIKTSTPRGHRNTPSHLSKLPPLRLPQYSNRKSRQREEAEYKRLSAQIAYTEAASELNLTKVYEELYKQPRIWPSELFERTIHNKSPHRYDRLLQVHLLEARLISLQSLLTRFPLLLNQPFSTGETPLTFACAHSNIQTVGLLLKLGAKVNLPDGRGHFALHTAIEKGNIATACCLLKVSGIDVDVLSPSLNSSIHLACQAQLFEVTKRLLPKTKLLNYLNQAGMAPIHLVSMNYSIPLGMLLLKAPDLDLDLETSTGETALSLATENKFYWMTKALLLRHASPNRILPSKVSLFEAIVSKGDEAITEALLKNALLDPNQKDGFQKPLLHVCIQQNWKSTAKALLKLGANPKLTNAIGLNALEYSLQCNRKTIALRLLMHQLKSVKV